MTRRAPPRFLMSLEGFSVIVLVGTLAVIGIYVICWALFDPEAAGDDRFGLPDDLAGQILAAYAPSIGATLLGYRDFILRSVRVGRARRRPRIPIHEGGLVLYGTAVFGMLVAAVIVIAISRGVKDSIALWMIGAGATAWAGSIGVVFARFMRSYLEPTEPVPPAATDTVAKE